MYGLDELSNPFPETLEIDVVKRHLGIDAEETYYDPDLPFYVETARLFAEGYTGLSLAKRQFLYSFDRFPSARAVYLPRSPLLTVDSVKYLDTDYVQRTFDASNYRVFTSSKPGGFELITGASWPGDAIKEQKSIEVTFTAGYTAENLLPGLRQAMLVQCGYMFDSGRGIGQEATKAGIQEAIQSLLDTYVVGDFFRTYHGSSVW